MGKVVNTDLWNQLSEGEQTYLAAIFATDQSQEVFQRQYPTGKPASEWRWIPFNRSAVGELTRRLDSLNHTRAQSVRIFKKLKEHGLINYRTQGDDHYPTQYLAVQITKQGRALVRAATGAPKKALTAFQQRFAIEVAELGLAPLEEAYRAFETRNDAQIKAWKTAVEQLRLQRRREDFEEHRLGRTIRTEQCAWCGETVEIKVYPGRHYAPSPVRHVHISYDDQDHWIEQYGCSPACVAQIRQAQVTVVLKQKEEEE